MPGNTEPLIPVSCAPAPLSYAVETQEEAPMDTEEKTNRQDEIAALQEEIRQLRAELGKIIGDTAASTRQSARDFARELQEELKETLDTARDRSRDFIDQARDKGEDAIDQLEEKIERYPLLSLFLVFLAGVLLGKLFDRR